MDSSTICSANEIGDGHYSGTVLQTISMDVESNIILHQVCDTDPDVKSMSRYICRLIREDAKSRGYTPTKHVKSRMHTKKIITRWDVVRSTILPKLYDLAGDGVFEYRHFCKYMAEAPISVSRECVIKDYLHRLVSLGYVYPYVDESSGGCVKNELTLDTKFLLSGEIVAAEGKLEGLQ